MTVIAPETRCERWLYTVLTADPTIAGIVGTRIYAHPAPKQVTTYPFITYMLLAPAGEIYGNEATIIWTKLVYLVRATTRGGLGSSVTSLQTLVDRLHTVLHAQHGATADARIDYCVRRRTFRMTEADGDVRFEHLGGEYELAVAQA